MRDFLIRSAAAAAFVLAVTLGDASADRLVAGGTTLTGKVTSITSKGVEFQLEFAKDAFLVPWKNVEDLSTDGPYEVIYGEAGVARAPVRAYHDGKLVIGDAEVAPDDIASVVAAEGDMPGFRDSMRSAMRYWHGGFDLGITVQQATNDNFGAVIALHALRAKGPTRLILGAGYRYAEENDKDSPEKRTKDAADALVRGEYDITKSFYAFASTDVLYDSIQNLSLRAVPKAGAGYVIWQREPKEGVRDFLQAEAGAGWVYEKYMPVNDPTDPDYDPDGSDDSYFTIALGAAAAVLLPHDVAIDWRFDYLPDVSDWESYVVRTGAGLSALVIEPVSLRIALLDVYDSTPSGDSDENSLNFDTTLSLAW